jgi:hypothetical protein
VSLLLVILSSLLPPNLYSLRNSFKIKHSTTKIVMFSPLFFNKSNNHFGLLICEALIQELKAKKCVHTGTEMLIKSFHNAHVVTSFSKRSSRDNSSINANTWCKSMYGGHAGGLLLHFLDKSHFILYLLCSCNLRIHMSENVLLYYYNEYLVGDDIMRTWWLCTTDYFTCFTAPC